MGVSFKAVWCKVDVRGQDPARGRMNRIQEARPNRTSGGEMDSAPTHSSGDAVVLRSMAALKSMTFVLRTADVSPSRCTMMLLTVIKV